MTYALRVDENADRDVIQRAMDRHPQACPVYRSLHPQIEISTSLEIVED